jgi:hypothetical protein
MDENIWSWAESACPMVRKHAMQNFFDFVAAQA